MALELGTGPVTAAETRAGALERADRIMKGREELVRGRLWERIRTVAFMDGKLVMSVRFDEGPCDFARDVLCAEVRARENRQGHERMRAVRFLTAFLAKGPEATTRVQAAAEADGIAIPTLKRAQKEMGVQSFRGRGEDHTWYMGLPGADRPDPSAMAPCRHGVVGECSHCLRVLTTVFRDRTSTEKRGTLEAGARLRYTIWLVDAGFLTAARGEDAIASYEELLGA